MSLPVIAPECPLLWGSCIVDTQRSSPCTHTPSTLTVPGGTCARTMQPTRWLTRYNVHISLFRYTYCEASWPQRMSYLGRHFYGNIFTKFDYSIVIRSSALMHFVHLLWCPATLFLKWHRKIRLPWKTFCPSIHTIHCPPSGTCDRTMQQTAVRNIINHIAHNNRKDSNACGSINYVFMSLHHSAHKMCS